MKSPRPKHRKSDRRQRVPSAFGAGCGANSAARRLVTLFIRPAKAAITANSGDGMRPSNGRSRIRGDENLREAHVLSRRAFAGAMLGTVVVTTRSAARRRRLSIAADPGDQPVSRRAARRTPSAASCSIRFRTLLGQPMVIEAKPGAGGIVGFADVAKADPDGYTLVTSSTSMGTGLVLHRHLPYDPVTGFRVGGDVRGAAERAGRIESRAASRRSPISSRRRRQNPAR